MMHFVSDENVCGTCGSTLELDMPSGFCPGCLLDAALEVSSSPRPGAKIDEYELLNEIARGGMGIVYRARQRLPSRIVALKMILPAHLNSPGAVNRFRAEAEAAASLDHECILPIYAVGEADGAPFYSMKFADGGTLSARLGEYRDKPHSAAALIAKLARAVAYAHEHGILHRDLKPGNVLFDSAGKPYVSDFGLAKWLTHECDLTQTLAILGTPYYMAPEQARDSKAVTAAADIYSLGAILFHLITGRPPVEGATAMEVLHRAATQPARLTHRGVPRDLATICLKCLEKEPAARYENAAALAEDLDRFCADRPIRARRVGLTSRAWRWMRRNPAIAALVACLLALVVAGVARDQSQRRDEQRPTHNAEAYAAFVKGTEALRRPAINVATLEGAQHLLERATALDPQFALAHARLSRAHSLIFSYFVQSDIHRRVAKEEAEESLRLQPRLGEAHLALATYLSFVERDYAAALKDYDIARAAAPNDPYVWHGLGKTHMRMGRWDEAVADLEHAASLAPDNWNMWDVLGNAYSAVRKYSAAEHAKRRMVEVLPKDLPAAQRFNQEQSWAGSYYDLTGSWEKFDELFARAQLSPQDDPDGVAAFLRFDQQLGKRDFAGAEETLANTPATFFDLWGSARITRKFLLGELALAQGDLTKARPFFEAELPFAQQEVRESPEAAPRHSQLGLLYAYLGRKDEAIAEGRRGVELLPLSKDPMDGIVPLAALAEIYGRVGEPKQALDVLEQLLTVPNGFPIHVLGWWQWDPLRDDPRFQDLIARHSK